MRGTLCGMAVERDDLIAAVNDAAAAYSEFFREEAPDLHALDDHLERVGVDPEALWEVVENLLVEVAPFARLRYLRANDEAWTRWLIHQEGLAAQWIVAGLMLGRRERVRADV